MIEEGCGCVALISSAHRLQRCSGVGGRGGGGACLVGTRSACCSVSNNLLGVEPRCSPPDRDLPTCEVEQSGQPRRSTASQLGLGGMRGEAGAGRLRASRRAGQCAPRPLCGTDRERGSPCLASLPPLRFLLAALAVPPPRQQVPLGRRPARPPPPPPLPLPGQRGRRGAGPAPAAASLQVGAQGRGGQRGPRRWEGSGFAAVGCSPAVPAARSGHPPLRAAVACGGPGPRKAAEAAGGERSGGGTKGAVLARRQGRG